MEDGDRRRELPSRVPRPAAEGLPDQRVVGPGLITRTAIPPGIRGCLGRRGRSRSGVDGAHLPPDGSADGHIRRDDRGHPGRARHHRERVPCPRGHHVLHRLLETQKIVLSELDFPTDGHVSLAHRRRGAEVVFLESSDGLTIPPEAYSDAIDEDTALVIVNRVLYRTSALLDAKEICRMAREAGAWTVVDDFHGAGIVPVEVHDLGCDFYTTGGGA